jgi:large subunit ribosomal protein L33
VFRAAYPSCAPWKGTTEIMPRELAVLACTECKRRNYTTTRNKKASSERLEIKKYCPSDRKRTVHKEVR